MNVKHFSFCGAYAVELNRPRYAPVSKFETLTGEPRRQQKLVKDGHLFACGDCPVCARIHATVRRVEYSENPSNHLCNAACMNAVGPSCECSCGGLNHGGNGYNPNQTDLFGEDEQ